MNAIAIIHRKEIVKCNCCFEINLNYLLVEISNGYRMQK